MDIKIFFLVLVAVISANSQCPATPSITSFDVCQVVSQGSLSYLCRDDGGGSVAWSSSVWSGSVSVSGGTPVAAFPVLSVSGVTLNESNVLDVACVNSTLTFNGDLTALTALNGATLICNNPVEPDDTVTIVVPDYPGSPNMMSVPSITCGGSSGNQVTLQWTPPTNTGGQGVVITHYNITGLPQSENCSPGPCDMVDGTATIITGLQCNTSYTIAVRAVNCRGMGSASQLMMISLSPPGPPSFVTALINNDNLILNWTSPVDPPSDCSLSYTLNISDADSSPITTNSTSAMVPVDDGSDNYTVTIFASNGCGAGPARSTVIIAPSSTAPPSAVSTMTPTTSGTTAPPGAGIGLYVGGAVGGIIVVAVLSALIGFILGCVCCPCLACSLLCRKKLCGCCPESWICYGPYADDVEYGEPTPHYEKQPVKETKEKDVETGQPSYPPGPMYQDPNTIQRQAAPSGDLYAQPEKPARHQKQKPAVEMATYQDPNTIQRQAAPTTGDLYAQPEKPLKQPPGPAPVYSQVDKPQAGGMEYADLSHSEAPPNARRRAPVPDTFYAEVRESRP